MRYISDPTQIQSKYITTIHPWSQSDSPLGVRFLIYKCHSVNKWPNRWNQFYFELHAQSGSAGSPPPCAASDGGGRRPCTVLAERRGVRALRRPPPPSPGLPLLTHRVLFLGWSSARRSHFETPLQYNGQFFCHGMIIFQIKRSLFFWSFGLRSTIFSYLNKIPTDPSSFQDPLIDPRHIDSQSTTSTTATAPSAHKTLFCFLAGDGAVTFFQHGCSIYRELKILPFLQISYLYFSVPQNIHSC